jgi:hypothetical protein
MAYADYNLDRALRDFSLELHEGIDLFGRVREIQVSPRLRSHLDEGVPLAVTVNTEKMRAELITAPILGEVWRLARPRVSLFSGIEFDVSKSDGLTGTCDFILAASRTQLFLENPVFMVVEAKNEDIKGGLGRCAAEMVAARLSNERRGEGTATIYGAVTTGSNWRFLKLDSSRLLVDRHEHYFEPLGRIVAMLLHCVGVDPATVEATAEEGRRRSERWPAGENVNKLGGI